MGNKDEKNKTILNFIDRFTSNGTRQEDFSLPQSKIYYDEIANHFGYYDQEANCIYDITGDVTNKYDWEPWEEVIDKDLLHAKRIVRDCIKF